MKISKEHLIELIKKNPELEIEIYKGKFNDITSTDLLHTDNCEWADVSLEEIEEDDLLDYGVISAEDYNRTIYANCGEEQEEPIIAIIIKNK